MEHLPSPTSAPSRTNSALKHVLTTLSASFLLSCQASPLPSAPHPTLPCTISQKALPETISGDSIVLVPGEIVPISDVLTEGTPHPTAQELFARTGSIEPSSLRRIPFSIRTAEGPTYRGVALFDGGIWTFDTHITPLEHTILRLMEEIYNTHRHVGFQSVGITLNDGYVQDLLSAAKAISTTKEEISRIHITHFDHRGDEGDIVVSPPPACS